MEIEVYSRCNSPNVPINEARDLGAENCPSANAPIKEARDFGAHNSSLLNPLGKISGYCLKLIQYNITKQSYHFTCSYLVNYYSFYYLACYLIKIEHSKFKF